MQYVKELWQTKKKLFLALTFSLLGILIAGLLLYALYFTRLFVLKEIKVYGNVKVSKEEVLRMLDLKGGEILYRLDLAQLRERLKKHHLIEEVMLRRQLPSTLEVQVKERSPLAILVQNNKGYLIDRKGVILFEANPNDILYYPYVIIEDEKNKDIFFNFLAWLKQNKKYLPVYENLQKILLTKDKVVLNTKSHITIYLPLTTANELFTLYSYLDRIMTYIYDKHLEDRVELIRLDYPFGRALVKYRST